MRLPRTVLILDPVVCQRLQVKHRVSRAAILGKEVRGQRYTKRSHQQDTGLGHCCGARVAVELLPVA